MIKRNKREVSVSLEKRKEPLLQNTREKGRESSSVTFNLEREHIQTKNIKRTFRE